MFWRRKQMVFYDNDPEAIELRKQLKELHERVRKLELDVASKMRIGATRYDENMQPQVNAALLREPSAAFYSDSVYSRESVSAEQALRLLLEHAGLELGITTINGYEHVYLVEDNEDEGA
jgi:hypothetical protein